MSRSRDTSLAALSATHARQFGQPSYARASTSRASPSRASPSRVSPSRVSPSHASPSRASPSCVSPSRAKVGAEDGGAGDARDRRQTRGPGYLYSRSTPQGQWRAIALHRSCRLLRSHSMLIRGCSPSHSCSYARTGTEHRCRCSRDCTSHEGPGIAAGSTKQAHVRTRGPGWRVLQPMCRRRCGVGGKVGWQMAPVASRR